MIFMISVIRGDKDEIVGMRIIDTETEKTMEATKESIIKAMTSNKVIIENIEYKQRAFKGVNGELYRYTNEYIKDTGRVLPKALVIMYKTSDGRFVCSDGKGDVQSLTASQIIENINTIGLANGKVVNNDIVPFSVEYKVVELTQEQSNTRNKLRATSAKSALLGVGTPDLKIKGDDITLRKLPDNAVNYTVPSYITGIKIGSMALGYYNRQKGNYPSLKSVRVTGNVRDISAGSFYGCKSLENVEIETDKLRKISDYTFLLCSSLKKIVIPDGVEIICKKAFSGCESLASIHIPDSVSIIEEFAFENCSSLKRIRIPYNVKDIKLSMFRYCSALEVIEAPKHLYEKLSVHKDKLKLY